MAINTFSTAGARSITLTSKGLPPNKRVYLYVNQFNLTPLTAAVGATSRFNNPIFTDSTGSLVANVYIPNNQFFSVPIGPVKLSLVDNPNWPENSSTFVAETTVEAIGDSIVPFFNTESGLQRPSTNISNVNFPLSQTFKIDNALYPQGIYIKTIELFFRTKSPDQPVVVEFRKCTLGVPDSTSFITGSSVVLQPADVIVPSNKDAGLGAPTVINFDSPVFLKTGETYGLTILSNSSDYTLYTGKINEKITGATNNSVITKQPYVGELFKTQLLKTVKRRFFGLIKKTRYTKTWTGDASTSLCFNLIKAEFETGTKLFNLQNTDMPLLNYDSIYVSSSFYNFGDLNSVDYKLQTKNTVGTTSGFNPVQTFIELPQFETKVANTAGDVNLQVTFNNKSADVSPILDLSRTYFSVTRYEIDPLTSRTTLRTSELEDKTSIAKARYVGKQVTLAQGVRANGIKISLSVNRKIYTDIDVFVKIRSSTDFEILPFENLKWQRIPLRSDISVKYAGLADNSYTSEVYENLALSYDSATVTGKKYTDFNSYQIKIVFYSDNNSVVPKVKDLIATAIYG